mgnify:CR=1 FL=1
MADDTSVQYKKNTQEQQRDWLVGNSATVVKTSHLHYLNFKVANSLLLHLHEIAKQMHGTQSRPLLPLLQVPKG